MWLQLIRRIFIVGKREAASTGLQFLPARRPVVCKLGAAGSGKRRIHRDRTRPADFAIGAPRRQPTVGTICRLTLNADEHLIGLVWNISSGGLSMLVHRRLEAGTVLEGVLLTANEANSLPIKFRVAHVGPLRTGDYIIGGPFVRPLGIEEMGPFVV
jgi:hypothetical protein